MKIDKKKLAYLCVGACVTTTCFPAIQVDAAGLSATSLNVGDQNTATGNYVATIGYKNKATGENSIVVGDNSQATGASSVAMGSEAKALAKNSFALGTKTTANGVSSVAFGNGTSTAAGATGATAFGYETKANAVSATAFGFQTEASGSNSTTFGNNTKASGEQSTAFGSETIADGKNATAFGYKTNAKGEDATAFGIRTIASGTQATAFGLENIASAKSATAFGSNNTASGENSTVFGAKNIASGSLSTVFGFESKATNIQATAFGNSTEATGVVATAFGNESVANGTYATAFGNWTVANGTASTAFGAGSHAYGKKSTAFGSESRAHGENSLAALGGYTGANALNGVALGWGSKVEKADTYALGTLSTAHGEKGATAIGTSSLAAGDYTTAIGYQAGSQSTATMAPNDGTVRIDTSSLQKSNDSIFIGKNAGRDVLGADNVVIGNYDVADNAPGTNKGTFTGITAVGREAKVLSNKGVAVGYTSSVAANSESAIAIGDQASAKNAPKGIAIGKGAKAEAEDAISIGTGNTVSGAHSGAIGDPTTITGTGTYTIGNNNGIVAANNSGAFGNNNTFTGAINNVRIIGNNNTVTVDDAMILGNKSTVTGVAGVAIGTNAKANNANDVALGANSETTVAVGTPSASINGVTHNFAGIAPNSTVSVGKSGAERTITNVAAGRISATSTDAINGSQLFAVTEEINKGIVYAGDVKAAAAGANEFTQKLGEKTNIVGGVTNEADLTNNNIGVVSNGDDTLTVKLKKDVDLGANGSLKTGATTINNDGFKNGNVKVTNTGLDNGGNVIKNVASGNVNNNDTDNNNAATIGDLKKVVADGAYDWKLSDGTSAATNVADGSTVNIKGSANAAPTTTVGVTTTHNGNDIAVDLSQKAKDDIQKGVDAKTKVDTEGLTFTGDTGTTGTKKLGDTVTVKGGATGTLSDGNIGVVSDGTGTLNVKLAKTLSGLDSVTAGGTTINNGGLTVGGKNYVSPTGINANNQKITNVADGTVGAGSKDAVNGGQLHEAKNELNTNISNAKTELINKGLRFDADNNSEKTNKLGSKVTVNGDDNITTEITQTGDDTKIGVKLKKDLNVTTVTATDTVKAGGVTMGKQADGANPANTGNYITGLDNKDWDADKIVSGRAATEDQLKKALDAQSANSTDYRLIRNQAAGSNGDYTVDANGDVALTVQDKNHPNQTETVTIKDVASKSKLDKLNDRAVKYDLDPNGTPNKSKVTYEGPAYNNKQGGTHVTNVAYATGNDGSEAVNVDYLNDKIKDSADALTNKGLKFDANVGGEQTNKLGSKVTIKGEGTAADADYSGENLKTFITQDQTSGDTTINVKMNKNLKAESVKVGKDGKDGVSITGPDTANGTDGKVAVTGKDGKEAVSISGKDGVGHIGLNGKDGRSADISVEKGDPDLNGNEITRIKYTDENGKTHQVATKDDGMAYGGDSGNVIKKKLNEQLDIKGGVTNEDDLTENNIGVISKNNILNVRLAKDLKDLNSITFNNGANGANGKTVVNGEGMTIKDAAGNPLTAVTKDGVKITDGPSMTKDGIDAAGKKVTNVADGTVAKDSKDAVNGGQLHDAVESLKTKGFGLEAEDGQSVKKALGETVKVKGDDKNIKTSVDGGAVKVELKKDITVDTVTANTVTTGDTKMDTNGVTIKDGANEATKLTKDGLQINDGGNKAVTINKDGLTIENGPKVTKDGIDAADKKITNVADGTIGAGSKDAVNGGQLHTAIEDIKTTGFGLKAEDGQSVKKPLGETIDLKGDGNIKTSVDNGAIKMALNDKITLGQDPAKQVNIDGSAGTITAGNGGNQVKIDGNDGSVTANTVKAGDVVVGKQTSDGKEGNFVTGLDNKTWNPENPVAVPGRAATEDQLKAVNDDFNNKARTGRVFQGDQPGDSGKVVRGLGDTMNLTGGADVNRLADNNIGVVKNAAGDGYNIKLAKDLKGLESVTTTDAAGNTTVMNGGGVTITPAQGNAVSLTKDGLNNGGNRITNVGPGVDGTDAVNVNQLSSAMRSVDGKIADVGATSAAISGLKPLQYDPLEPTQVLAAVGHYKGSTAAAVGVAHYTNESTMFHMGVSLGGHDNMINAGVSYKFGTSDAKKAIPARYKAGPISSAYVLQDEVTALKAENERMKQHDLELTAKYDQVQRDNEEMKAQIALLMQQVGLSK
ncbi:YadA-like family protein [Veillonella parvula]|uniref:YadA-like family protein n=1 Tax=Veillonella parvula TaxID=29466 RepID=UPI001C8BB9D2|nr:YadA-like family protein [Veillonella parvula]MBX8924523.1 hemagglutinin [Veillonella parvula]